MDKEIFNALFSTHAVRVCDAEAPFWYTSGKIGPFYINTHFLFGSEKDAVSLLAAIEKAAEGDRLLFPKTILSILLEQYHTNAIFRMITDKVTEKAKALDFDFISGGERRDFFFSILPAYFLEKPHLSIFKDESSVYSDAGFSKTVSSDSVALQGQKSLHIVDLVTEASSYTRAWLPVIRKLGAKMEDTITVIDRQQGGEDVLKKEGVRLFSLFLIDSFLFDAAKDSKEIDEKQYQLVKQFLNEPEGFMPAFIKSHPDFIEKQILLGGKAKERALLAVEKGFAALPQ